MNILGIDIGGSGIKGAPVDTDRGKLTAEHYRIPTPQPFVVECEKAGTFQATAPLAEARVCRVAYTRSRCEFRRQERRVRQRSLFASAPLR